MHLALLALFSAVLLIFSFPTADLALLTWFALVPLMFLAEESKSKKQLFLYSYLSGLLFWSGLGYWMCYVSIEGFLLSIGYLAFYFPAFVFLCRFVRRRAGLSTIWSAPIVWTSLEYLRTYLLTGFPWGILGTTQHAFLPLIQISEWTGVYGVSFMVVLGNAWLFEVLYVIVKKRESLRFTEVSIPLVAVVAVFIYGGTFFSFSPKLEGETQLASSGQETEQLYLVKQKEPKENKSIRVAVVQGNIPQDIKMDKVYEQFIEDEYTHLSVDAAKKEKLDLLIWPETALPVYLRYDEGALEMVGKLINKIQIPLLVGASDIKKIDAEKGFEISNRRYLNSAFLLVPGKGFACQYDKIHLVPFGEYVPCSWIPFLRKLVPIEDVYSSGSEYTVFDFAIPFSTIICFEDVFPNLVRHFVKHGAQWLVNMTNDGWFRNSSAPMQHAMLALFRCVENRVWMVRSTNTGVSCFIDPYGRIVNQVEGKNGKNIWVSGFASGTIHPGLYRTFYTRFGDVFSWLNLGALVLLLSWRRGSRPAQPSL